MSDPKKGRALPFKLKDKTWHHSEGWIKIEKLVKSNNGKTINIHYVRNENTGEMDDFKVIDEDLR